MKNLVIVLILICLGCETPIEPALPPLADDMVIYSFFRPGSPMEIDVFNLVPISQQWQYSRRDDLSVILYEDSEKVEVISSLPNGFYLSQLIPEQGKNYRLEIQSGQKLIKATTSIPPGIELEEVKLGNEIEDINLGEFGYPISIQFTDPADEQNFYAVEVYVDKCFANCENDEISGDLNELLLEDVKVDAGGSEVTIVSEPNDVEGLPFLYFNDNVFNGQHATLNFHLTPGLLDFENVSNTKVKVILKSLTPEYFNYLQTSDYQVKAEDEGGLVEPVHLSSNIENAAGVFAGYNYSIFTLSLDEF